MHTTLQLLRADELSGVRKYFTPGMHVLELGGGDGFQASQITSWGCDVFSLDIARKRGATAQHHPVVIYNGRDIPTGDHCFDMVFSSNVLEHVTDIKHLLAEVSRVLKPGGIGIHIVPSASWRFWTSAAHYIYLFKYLLMTLTNSLPTDTGTSLQQLAKRHGIGNFILRTLIPGPHGEFASAASEIMHFRRSAWVHLLEENNFHVTNSTTNHLFYTGYLVFPRISLPSRHRLACVLGSACHVLLTERVAVASHTAHARQRT